MDLTKDELTHLYYLCDRNQPLMGKPGCGECAPCKAHKILSYTETDCCHENASQRSVRALTCPDCGACLEHWD